MTRAAELAREAQRRGHREVPNDDGVWAWQWAPRNALSSCKLLVVTIPVNGSKGINSEWA